MLPYYHEIRRQQPWLTAELFDCYQKVKKPNNPRDYDIYDLKVVDYPSVLIDYVKRAGLTIDNAKFFHSKPGFKSIIHVDADGRHAALNIPLSIGGPQYWYNQNWDSVKRLEPTHVFLRMAAEKSGEIQATDHVAWQEAEKVHYEFMDRTKPEPVARLVLCRPTCLSISNWHQIHNDTPQDRVIFTVRFRENPTVAEMADRFGKIGNL